MHKRQCCSYKFIGLFLSKDKRAEAQARRRKCAVFCPSKDRRHAIIEYRRCGSAHVPCLNGGYVFCQQCRIARNNIYNNLRRSQCRTTWPVSLWPQNVLCHTHTHTHTKRSQQWNVSCRNVAENAA